MTALYPRVLRLQYSRARSGTRIVPALFPLKAPMNGSKPRYIVVPGSQLFERCVHDQLTDRIVWGPRRDIRAAEREAVKLNRKAADDPPSGRGEDGAAASPPPLPIKNYPPAHRKLLNRRKI
jgi:hypothetical protein